MNPDPVSKIQSPDSGNSGELLEQVVERFTQEVRAGSNPDVDQWVQDHPHLSDELSDLLSSVAMIEGLKNFSPTTSHPQSRFADVEIPDYLGEYKIVREIGRGGMGIVLEAVHETLGRRVAIKVMVPGAMTTSSHLERFHREAVAAASLHHTNIVSVFGAGEDQGFQFYVMEFVDGQSISQMLKNRVSENQETSEFRSPSSSGSIAETAADESQTIGLQYSPDPNEAATVALGPERYKWVAETGIQIADALAYAHEKEILHRDIKPANLVLDANDTVWLTDFGLAKSIQGGIDQTVVTKTGDILGTPQYMAPESFSGKYDCRSETYCLGLTLYELATLKPAFANASTPEVIRAVTAASPTAPRKIDPQLPADLSTVIEKAIAKEPSQRYQTAAELRDDLRAFVEDRPISARRTTMLGQFVRFSRRNPLAASLMGLLVLTLGLLTATAAVGYLATSSALSDLREKQIDLREKQSSLQKEQVATRQALQLAEYSATQSKIQSDRAQNNVDVALEAFDQVFRQLISRGTGRSGDLDIDGFQQIAGIERAITEDDALFVEQLLEFYNRLEIGSGHNRDFRTESATASRRIANVYRLVGENEKSLEAYTRAITTFEELADEQPSSVDALLDAVATRNERSSLMGATGKWREALADLVKSHEQLTYHLQAEDAGAKLYVVHTLNQLTSGPVEMMFSPMPQSEQTDDLSGSQGVDLYKPLIDGKLQPAPFGDMIQQVRSLAIEAVEISQQLHQQSPLDVKVSVARAESLCHLALVERMLGGDARVPLAAAIDELKTLQQKTPDQPQFQYLLSLTNAIASQDESPEKSLALLKESKTTLETLANRYEKILPYRQLYSAVCIQLADLQIDAEQLVAARGNLTLAGDLLVQLRNDAGRDLGTRINRRKLMKQFQLLSDSHAANGDFETAAEVEFEVDRIQRKLDGK